MQFQIKACLIRFFLTRTYQTYAPNERLHAAVSLRRDQAAADYRRRQGKGARAFDVSHGCLPQKL